MPHFLGHVCSVVVKPSVPFNDELVNLRIAIWLLLHCWLVTKVPEAIILLPVSTYSHSDNDLNMKALVCKRLSSPLNWKLIHSYNVDLDYNNYLLNFCEGPKEKLSKKQIWGIKRTFWELLDVWSVKAVNECRRIFCGIGIENELWEFDLTILSSLNNSRWFGYISRTVYIRNFQSTIYYAFNRKNYFMDPIKFSRICKIQKFMRPAAQTRIKQNLFQATDNWVVISPYFLIL